MSSEKIKIICPHCQGQIDVDLFVGASENNQQHNTTDHEAIKHFEALKKKYPGALDHLYEARSLFIGWHRKGELPFFKTIHVALYEQKKWRKYWPSFGKWIAGRLWESTEGQEGPAFGPEEFCKPATCEEAFELAQAAGQYENMTLDEFRREVWNKKAVAQV